MVLKRQRGNWEFSLMESQMSHPVAPPIRCWYVSVVTPKREDYFASAFKVCTFVFMLDRFVFFPFSSKYFTMAPCVSLNTAYRLQFCLPPPIIPNAEILMASKEFKIGRWESQWQKRLSSHIYHTQSLLFWHSHLLSHWSHPDWWTWSISILLLVHPVALTVYVNPASLTTNPWGMCAHPKQQYSSFEAAL